MLLLIQFFTKIPINKSLACEKSDFRKSLWFLPVLGGLIGAVQGLAFYLSQMVFPVSIAIIFAMVTEYIITGGFHMDGYADASDGFFSGRRGEEAYKIMKDGVVGPFGALSLIILVLLQFEGLKIIAFPLVFVLLGIVSKTVILMLAYRSKAYGGGLGGTITNNVSVITLIFSLLIMNGMFIYSMGIYKGLVCFIIISIFIMLFRKFSYRIIGGISGDQYGFVHEISKVIIILIMGYAKIA
ncbi:MAG: adenosylcobinamide-GDP ribazoletransferase [Bacillota bacterium]|nr:adenosylcobinamide-GDP ribazoletransferase [Bacillota bacterium]